MLDEPFSHLSPLQVDEVIALLIEEKQSKGFLITDHMFKHIVEVSDLLYILVDGKTHLSNKAEDVELLGYARL
jgi:ABC-type lipopolysaccharide export system ATPase subunit